MMDGPIKNTGQWTSCNQSFIADLKRETCIRLISVSIMSLNYWTGRSLLSTGHHLTWFSGLYHGEGRGIVLASKYSGAPLHIVGYTVYTTISISLKQPRFQKLHKIWRQCMAHPWDPNASVYDRPQLLWATSRYKSKTLYYLYILWARSNTVSSPSPTLSIYR